MKKKIAIIGAGFTGLSAAYYLAKSGHKVTVIESDTKPGGLAIGFKDSKWDWSLEKHYHHLFTSDTEIVSLAKAVNHPIIFTRPKTSTFIDGKIYQFDSPLHVLKFPLLNFVDRFRTGSSIAVLKFFPVWQIFEYFTAEKYLRVTQGETAWKLLWEPLLVGKFGTYSSRISASWFWARIFKRSMRLGYPEGGFQSLASDIASKCREMGVEFFYSESVTKIVTLKDSSVQLHTKTRELKCDQVISTLPFPSTAKLNEQLSREYQNFSREYLGAVTLVMAIKKPFLPDNTYWLNINDRKFPFLSVVEHTNYVDPSHYDNERIVYVGNYVPLGHEYFSLTPRQLINKFSPYLKKINPNFSLANVINVWSWSAPFAQPVVTTRYASTVPPLQTPLPNVFVANIQQVYPWDRGTNYAVELGKQVATLCEKN